MSEKELHPLDIGEENDGVVTLVDEEGVEHDFEILDFLEKDEGTYVAVVPVYENAEDVLKDDADELVILKVIAEGAEEYLEAIEDELEFNRVSKEFVERLSEEYDIID